jgi:hypothetical protein
MERFSPSTTTTTAVVGHGGGKRIPAVVVVDDVVVAKRQYDHDRALAEIRRKQRYDRNANMRKFGIAVCILGVAIYFLAGGRLKLPFFGDLGDGNR